VETTERIRLIKEHLKKVDSFSDKFSAQIQQVVDKHKKEGGNLEYVYVEHFHKEIRGLSALFQYLLGHEKNKKYVFFAVRASVEILLYLEYVLRLSKLGGNEILSLLSKDMAQSAAAVNQAASTDDGHPIHATLKKIALVKSKPPLRNLLT